MPHHRLDGSTFASSAQSAEERVLFRVAATVKFHQNLVHGNPRWGVVLIHGWSSS